MGFPQRNLPPEATNWAVQVETLLAQLTQESVETRQAAKRALQGLGWTQDNIIANQYEIPEDANTEFPGIVWTTESPKDVADPESTVYVTNSSGVVDEIWRFIPDEGEDDEDIGGEIDEDEDGNPLGPGDVEDGSWEPPTESEDDTDEGDDVEEDGDTDEGGDEDGTDQDEDEGFGDDGDVEGSWVRQTFGFDALSEDVNDTISDIETDVGLIQSHNTNVVDPAIQALDQTLTVDLPQAQSNAQQAQSDALTALQTAQNAALAVDNSISGNEVQYAVGASSSTAPSSGWSASQPTWSAGSYIWMRAKLTTVGDNVSYTAPVLLTGPPGATGAKGDKGDDGIAGKDGVGISGTTIHYAKSTSGTTTPSSGWQSTVPASTPGQYLWTRTVWTYTDNTTETGYSVAQWGSTGATGAKGDTGNDGIAGKDGVGISDTTIHYAKSSSGTTTPSSGWSSSVPSPTEGQYLWTRTVWTYTDNTTETGYSVSRWGEKGAKGATGLDGVSVESVVPYFASFSTEWTGEENASTSVLKIGGDTVAENIVTNPLGWISRNNYSHIVSATDKGILVEVDGTPSGSLAQIGSFPTVNIDAGGKTVYAAVPVRNDGPDPLEIRLAFLRNGVYPAAPSTTILPGYTAMLTIDGDVFPPEATTNTLRLVLTQNNVVGNRFTILPPGAWASIGQPLPESFTGSTEPTPELAAGFLPPPISIDVNEPTATGVGYPGTALFVGDYVSTSQNYQYLLSTDGTEQRATLDDRSTPSIVNKGTPLLRSEKGKSPFYVAKFYPEGDGVSRFGKYYNGNNAADWLGSFRAVVFERELTDWEIDNALDHLLAGAYLEEPGTAVPTWLPKIPSDDGISVLYETWLTTFKDGSYSYTPPVRPLAGISVDEIVPIYKSFENLHFNPRPSLSSPANFGYGVTANQTIKYLDDAKGLGFEVIYTGSDGGWVNATSAGRVPVMPGKTYSLRLPFQNIGNVTFPVTIRAWIDGNTSIPDVTETIVLEPGESGVVSIDNYLAEPNAVDIRYSLYYGAGVTKPAVGAKLLYLDGAALVQGWGDLASWSEAMPPYQSGYEIFSSEKVFYTNNMVSYTPVVYAASTQGVEQAIHIANFAQQMAEGMVWVGPEEPPHDMRVEGQVWIVTDTFDGEEEDSEERMVGIYVLEDPEPETAVWLKYSMITGLLIVPGEDGIPTIIDQDGITVGTAMAGFLGAQSIAAESIGARELVLGEIGPEYLEDDLQNTIYNAERIAERVVIEPSGIIISRSRLGGSGPLTALKLEADRLSFVVDNEPAAYIDSSSRIMYIDNGVFTESVQIGEHLVTSLEIEGITNFVWNGGFN